MAKNLLLFVLLFGLNLQATTTSSDRYYVGGAVGTIVGLGIGHAIQGRYSEKGWIFTTGELSSMGVTAGAMIWGATSLASKAITKKEKFSFEDLPTGAMAVAVGGIILLGGFRIWEAIDVWVGADIAPESAPSSARYENTMENTLKNEYAKYDNTVTVPILSLNF